jgi:ABC-2 type transport system ATP-binding protein
LVLDGLAKRFGQRVAVEGLSFEVGQGEVFGLLGPNGAGKTTTVRMLTGLLRPSAGEARVLGHSLAGDGQALRRSVGLLTEQPGLYDRLSAADNLRFFIKLHGLDEHATWQRAQSYLAQFGLAGRDREPVGGYSKGMRQKLAIVRTLLHGPKLIFLDEPTSGLDPESARTVRDVLGELAQEGRTLVLCSHNLAEVERLCARVAVIKQRPLLVARVSELRAQGLTLSIRLGTAAKDAEGSLASLPFCPRTVSEGHVLKVILSSEDEAPEVVRALVLAGHRVHAVERGEKSLEDVYLRLVRGEEAADGV